MTHPYIGLDQFPTAATLIDDSDLPEAANINPPEETALDRGFFLWRRQQARIALNWSQLFQISGAYPTLTCLGWSALDRQWLAGASNAAHTAAGVWINVGLDASVSAQWSEVGGADLVVSSPNVFIADVLGDTLNASTYIAILVAPSAPVVDVYRFHSGAWSVVYSAAGNRNNGRLAYFVAGAGITTGGGPYVAAIASTSAAQCGITGSADGITWVDVGATYGGSQGLANPAKAWSLAQSPTSMIAVPQQTTSDQAYLRATVGGGNITWTKTAFTGGTLVAGDKPYAVAFGKTIDTSSGNTVSIYLVAVQANGGGTKILKSTDDGLTWVVVGSTFTSRVVTNLAAIGFLFVATTEEAAGGNDHTIFSIDGGATWHLTDAQAVNAGGALLYYQQPRIAVSDVGFAQNNTVWARMSAQWGITAAIS